MIPSYQNVVKYQDTEVDDLLFKIRAQHKTIPWWLPIFQDWLDRTELVHNRVAPIFSQVKKDILANIRAVPYGLLWCGVAEIIFIIN